MKHDRAPGTDCFNQTRQGKRVQSACVSLFGNLVLYDLFRLVSFFDAFGMNTIDLLFSSLSRRWTGARSFQPNSDKRALTGHSAYYFGCILINYCVSMRLRHTDHSLYKGEPLKWPLSIDGAPPRWAGAPHRPPHFFVDISSSTTRPSLGFFFCVSRASRMIYCESL